MSAVLVVEKPRARNTSTTDSSGSVERTFDIHGAPDDLSAKTALINWYAAHGDIPSGYSLSVVDVTEKNYSRLDSSLNCYEGVIRFAPPSPKSGALSTVYAFDVSTANFTLRQAYAQREFTQTGEIVNPTYGRAINVVKRDGQLVTQGLDVPTPIGNLRITKRFDMGEMSRVAERTYYKVGMVNLEYFDAGRGFRFDAEEVLFGGAQLAQVSERHFTATYNFLISPSEQSPKPIDGIVYPGKKGWEYLWCSYETVTTGGESETVPKRLTQKALSVFLARVYERTSFVNLLE